jgi:DNA-binding NarL/FixJ family response regulator
VLADPGHIEQVLLNLAVNASEAMPAGGTLEISTRNADAAEAALPKPVARTGRYLVLSVSDEGHGMDAETREWLFEPFFTTKQGGSGLGLATVYGIVNQCAGFIHVESELGQGSRFEVWLPCAEVKASLSTGDSPAGGKAQMSAGTVLLAEDEQLVRDLAVAVLERAGYRVLAAASGDRALELCREHTDEIDVLISDMVMPGIGGRELTEEVLRLRPSARVVLMSGYSDEPRSIGIHDDAQTRFLQKPFLPSELLSCIRELLEQPTGSSEYEIDPGTTCLVADDHPAVLDAVSRYLEQNGVEVLMRVSRGDEALAGIIADRPSIALLDVRMEPISGIEVARAVSRRAPWTQTVLYTAYSDRTLLKQALDAGARGFVGKDAPMPELLRALATVAGGGTYVDAQLADTLASGTVNTLSPLTSREQQVLTMIADRLTNEEIASALQISPETVQSHVHNAMEKLNADTRTQAVATALRHSLLVS